MMLTVEEVCFYLGVTKKWLHDVLDDGSSSLAIHTRCRRDETEKAGRSAIRIPIKGLWLYIWRNTISSRTEDFPIEPPATQDSPLVTLDEIRDWILWYRCGRPELPGEAIRSAMAAEGITSDQIAGVITRLMKLPAFRSRL